MNSKDPEHPAEVFETPLTGIVDATAHATEAWSERVPLPNGGLSATAQAMPGHGDDSYLSYRDKVVRHRWLFTLASAAMAMLAFVLWLEVHALASEVDLRQVRTRSLVADARAIAGLRSQPRQVAETGLRNADLLDRVTRAMRSADLDASSLVSTLPQPPRSRPGAAYAEVVHRLLFENVSVESLVRFAHALIEENPELHIAGLQLRARREDRNWNADVSIAYRVQIAADPRNAATGAVRRDDRQSQR